MNNSAAKPPEEYIKDFLEIIENQSGLFSDAAIKNLKSLDEIVKSKTTSNQDVAERILDWCKLYPDIHNALIKARKPEVRPFQPGTGEHILIDCPDLAKNLEKITNKPEITTQ